MSDIIGYTTVEQAYTSKGLAFELAKRDLLNPSIRKGEKWTNQHLVVTYPLCISTIR